MSEGSGEGLTSPSGKPLPAQIGGYKIIGRLSRGGMGEVLLGQKESHGFTKKVAIKVVLPHVADHEDYRTLFFDEARLVARMSHPNLTQVFDFGEDEGGLFLVMELIDGLSVERIFKIHAEAGRRMPAELAALVVAQAARGLHSAHTLVADDGSPLHVVHRDVSPQNLIVTWSGSTKVLDFGIARSKVRKGHTQIGVVRGKPGYMAPEQALNRPLDARTDIFQLGIVLFELLTTRELFVQDNMYAAIAAAVEKPAPRLEEVAGGLDPGYQGVLDLALAKDPEQRFSSADAFARALDNVIARGGRPVTEASLGDYIRSLRDRPPGVTGDRQTVPLLDPSARAGGRAEGQGTVPLAAGRPTSVATGLMDSVLPEERTADLEVSGPLVRTVSADAVGSAGPVVETGLVELRREQRRRRAVGIAAGLILLGALGAGLFFAVSDRGGGVIAEGPDPPLATDVPAGDPPAVDPSALDEGPAVKGADAGRPEPAEVAPAPADPDPAGRRGRARRRRSASGATDPAPAPPVGPVGETAPTKEPEPEPPPPPEDPAPAVVVYGSLSVVTEPFALLVVDGKPIGDTPRFGLKLPVGEHEVRLIDPASEETWRVEKVTLTKGKPVTLRRFKDRR